MVRWVGADEKVVCHTCIPEGLVRLVFSDIEEAFYAEYATPPASRAMPTVLRAEAGRGLEVPVPDQSGEACCRLVMSTSSEETGLTVLLYCSCASVDALCGLRVRLVAGLGGNALLALAK